MPAQKQPDRQPGPRFTYATSANPWCGRVSMPAGSASVVVSSSLVKSDSVFLHTMVVASVGANIQSAAAIVVTSIVPNVSFAFARANGLGAPFPCAITFELVTISRKPL